MVAPARRLATHVLHRVLHDDAWAAPALDAALRRQSLDRADAALSTQIVYGSLRAVPDLESALQRHARRRIEVDDWTRAALLGAAFQLQHLARVPPHAVVDDTVELVREKRGKRLGGFANAILRKLAVDRPRSPSPPQSIRVAPWLRRALEDSLGAQRTEQLLSIPSGSPSFDIRVRRDVDRVQVGDAIQRARPDASVLPTELSNHGLRLSSVGDPRELPGYAEGSFAVQEEGAQLIAELLGAGPGDRVLDACAGRGGKTAQLVEAVEEGRVVATDLHEHRLEQIPGELRRLGLTAERLTTACVDWTVGPGDARGPFDRVLVDAPCTGLGTLRRRPEIGLRTRPEDAARMGEIQRAILEQAAGTVRVGGTLLYAVCSPLDDEGVRVAESASLPGFELLEERAFSPKSLRVGSHGGCDLGPWVPGAGPWADAYQIYRWVYVG